MDLKNEYPFEFSVVMAVYNVEPFLREAVKSLVQQDFGFKRIQLIMVDDGSSDGSGAICDEYAAQYPDNVIVLHKENGGVASARNAGMELASGRYVNFMDSDDKFTKNAFSRVHSFFIKHEDETDVVTIPIKFFGEAQNEHFLNDKFEKGSRVIDLFNEYQASLKVVNASFFKASVIKNISFDSRLVIAEDAKFVLAVLSEKMTLGVVNGCRYLYRRRNTGDSLIQTQKRKYGWYFDYFAYFIDWAADFYKQKFGFLPAFVQYLFMTDLLWRFSETDISEEVLSPADAERYKERLFSSMRYIDDRYILEQKKLWGEHKCYILSKKYNCLPTLTKRYNNVFVHFGGTMCTSFARQFSKLEFLSIRDNVLSLEGHLKVLGVDFDVPLEPYVSVNNELFPCEIYERNDIHKHCLGDLIFRGVAFRVNIPLDATNHKEYKIKLILKYQDCFIVRRDLRFGSYFPVGKTYENSYFYSGGWIVRVKNFTLEVKRAGMKAFLKHEYKFLKELWKKNLIGGRKAVFGRLAYHVLKFFKHKPLWLISDRTIKADDNGEAFFRYIQKEHKKDIKSYFIIKKTCADYNRLKKIGAVADDLSYKHKLLFLLCDYNISSHADAITNNPFLDHHENFRDIYSQKRFIFLQHGVTKGSISDWLRRFNKNLYGFVTSAYPEWDSIVHGDYFYNEDHVWLTGMPRFDRRYSDVKNIITIMPTWRKYLVSPNSAGSAWQLNANFRESAFYVFYQGLFNHPRLLAAVKKAGYELCFFIHPNLQPHISEFEIDSSVKILGIDTSYNDIYAWSNLVVTDYSSAIFDFAYLRKPVIYCQFDKDEFFSGKHLYTKGYFDYERDGFGEVEYDLESTVLRIIEYIENGCPLKEKYRKRIDEFFAYNDRNNSKRVYEKIIASEKR